VTALRNWLRRGSGTIGAVLLLALSGCAPAGNDGGYARGKGDAPGERPEAPIRGAIDHLIRATSATGPIRMTATTGMVADLAAAIGGDRVVVEALMGPGVDPHLYKATQGDLEKLSGAEVIVYNGLHLEGKMGEIFERMGRTRPVVAVADGLPRELLRTPPEFDGNFDPHVWFDVALWSRCADGLVEVLSRFDPAGAGVYAANRDALQLRLAALDAWCRAEIATIPKERRVLVTAHDAFGYFGRAYDIEVLGLQGISTVAEFGLQDLTTLVDTLVGRRIPAVFVESSVPRKSIEALVEGCRQRGHPVRIGGELFSDAMGAAGTPEGNYEGMVRANVTTIVEALR
jgi:manganese/zinc/iron transport system substrate-binding protein